MILTETKQAIAIVLLAVVSTIMTIMVIKRDIATKVSLVAQIITRTMIKRNAQNVF